MRVPHLSLLSFLLPLFILWLESKNDEKTGGSIKTLVRMDRIRCREKGGCSEDVQEVGWWEREKRMMDGRGEDNPQGQKPMKPNLSDLMIAYLIPKTGRI